MFSALFLSKQQQHTFVRFWLFLNFLVRVYVISRSTQKIFILYIIHLNYLFCFLSLCAKLKTIQVLFFPFLSHYSLRCVSYQEKEH